MQWAACVKYNNFRKSCWQDGHQGLDCGVRVITRSLELERSLLSTKWKNFRLTRKLDIVSLKHIMKPRNIV